mmetsp:Transcript_4770/g.7612  ORF Transcript_4770/g.7612 Transcript_4770/m.7612 type:complete len:105 (-) Transcript_4770:59-373(-)
MYSLNKKQQKEKQRPGHSSFTPSAFVRTCDSMEMHVPSKFFRPQAKCTFCHSPERNGGLSPLHNDVVDVQFQFGVLCCQQCQILMGGDYSVEEFAEMQSNCSTW